MVRRAPGPSWRMPVSGMARAKKIVIPRVSASTGQVNHPYPRASGSPATWQHGAVGGTRVGLRPDEVVGLIDGPLGAYLHVPFCTRICPFCPYNKVVPRGDQPTAYFAALGREVDGYLAAGAGGAAGFTSLYVGGGTPTLFPELLAPIVARMPVTGMRAIEVLPTHGTPARLDALAAAGFSAVSIGAQSFSDDVLHRLRRPHDARTARAAVQAAVQRFELVDVDLIVDVALDDRLAAAFLRDLVTCFEFGADQVSTYPLMRFGYTPFGRAHHDRRHEHAVLAEATRLAHAHGYERRSVWTFNRRSSPTYTSITRRRFLGMGAGSASYLGRDFLVNHFGVQTYLDSTAGGGLPVARWLHLGALGGLAYDAFWAAYAGQVDPGALVGPGGARSRVVDGVLDGALVLLAGAGLVRHDGASYRLTERGFDAYHDLERAVTYAMIEPLWAQLLGEHAQEGVPAHWAAPGDARSPVLWQSISALLERRTEPTSAISPGRWR